MASIVVVGVGVGVVFVVFVFVVMVVVVTMIYCTTKGDGVVMTIHDDGVTNNKNVLISRADKKEEDKAQQ